MKSVIITLSLLAVVTWSATAGDVTLSLKQTDGLIFLGSLTNATRNQVYVAPFYQEEQFYAQPSCSDCATGWVAGRPMNINDAKDFIPLAPKASIRFVVIGNPNLSLPWRITCVAVTNSIHVSEKIMPDEKSRILIHSAEIPGVKIPPH